MLVLTVIEFRTAKIIDYDPLEFNDEFEDEFAGLSPEEARKRREFWAIQEKLWKGEPLDEFNLLKSDRSNLSAPDWYLEDKESVTSKAFTYPLDPGQEEEMMKGEFYNQHLRC